MPKTHQNKVDEIIFSIESKQRTLDKIGDLKKERGELRLSVQSIGRQSSELYPRIKSLEGTVERGGKGNANTANIQSKLQGCINDRGRLVKQRKQKEEKIEGITQEIELLLKSIDEVDMGLTSDELLVHRNGITEVTEQINNLQSLITKQNGIIASAPSFDDSKIESLKGKHENLLAEEEMGQDHQEEIVRIEQDIDVLEQEKGKITTEKSGVVNKAQKVIAGLQKKLSEATSIHKRLTSHTQGIISQFLVDECNKAGREYMSDTIRFVASYKRLIALNLLQQQINRELGLDPKSIVARGGQAFEIPLFHLPCFNDISDVVHNMETGVFYSSHNVVEDSDVRSMEGKEYERLMGVGIKELMSLK